MAALHTQNITPLLCSSLSPIGTAPVPGTLNAPGLGFQKGLRIDGFFVSGSSALNTSPKLYFAQTLSSIAYPIALWRSTTITPQSFAAVPVASLVIKNTLGQAKG